MKIRKYHIILMSNMIKMQGLLHTFSDHGATRIIKVKVFIWCETSYNRKKNIPLCEKKIDKN